MKQQMSKYFTMSLFLEESSTSGCGQTPGSWPLEQQLSGKRTLRRLILNLSMGIASMLGISLICQMLQSLSAIATGW